jgi:type IV pilus assembly protein PilX
MSKARNSNFEAPQRGISLIIVLILVVVIGLTASSAMRSATSSQRVTNNLRMEGMAQQYAEAALRFCEAQMAIPDPAVAVAPRVGTLLNATIPVVDITAGMQPAWLNTVSWTSAAATAQVAATPHAAATRTTLVAGQISSGISTYVPATLPECIVERQTLPGPFAVVVVTARGFSTDYQKDVNGRTTNGSVVWLQTILNMD